MKIRDVQLDILRGIAIVFVVAIHIVPYAGLSLEEQSYLYRLILTITVPVFFFADGYIVSNKVLSGTFIYRNYLKDSVSRLLVPWAVFSFIYLLARIVIELEFPEKQRIIVDKDLLEILVAIFNSQISPQLYFLLSLFFVRLVSPVAIWITKLPIWTLVVVMVTFALMFDQLESTLDEFEYLSEGLSPIKHAFWGYTFVIAGLLSNKLNFTHRNVYWFIPYSFMYLSYIYIPEWFKSSYQCFLLIGAFSFLKFDVLSKPLKWLGENTMAIYLLHAPIPIYILGSVLPSSGIVSLLVNVIGSIALSLLAGRVLKSQRLTRKLI